MAGHSKWANIKHRKERQDAKKGKIFTKIIRELTVAARQGGGVPADNPRLRLAVDKALTANMTRDTIDRAIARGVGAGEGENVEELTYEGYAPSGVAIIVEAMTDNRNRTAAEVRHAFNKCGGNLGTDGSVAYLFERKGQILVPKEIEGEGKKEGMKPNGAAANEEEFMMAVAEAGGDDYEDADEEWIVYTSPTELMAVKKGIEEQGIETKGAEFIMEPTTTTSVTPKDAPKVMRLIDKLEELEDLQSVYHTMEMTDEVVAALEG